MDFLHQYFLVPLISNGWFNPVNSLFYGLVLILGIWLVFKMLNKLKIRIDGRLFVSLIPFIAFAGVTRTLRDYIYFSSAEQEAFLQSFMTHMQIIQKNAYSYVFSATGNHTLAYIESGIIAWFPTPGSYLITFLLAMLSLFLSLIIQRYLNIEYWKPLFVIGLGMFLLNCALVPVNSYLPLVYIGSVSILWAALFFSIARLIRMDIIKKMNTRLVNYLKDIFTPMNSAILSAHFFDATATFFAIAMFSTIGGHGYSEQHFLSRSLMPFLGPQVMFLLKFVVVVPVLYFIDKYIEEKELSRFLKLAVLILGLAPASRNLARLMVGV